MINMTLNLPLNSSTACGWQTRHHGLSADAYTVQLLDRHLPCDSRAADLAALLQSWMDDEDDAAAQRETGEYLVRALDEDRLSERRLFPTERMGVTW